MNSYAVDSEISVNSHLYYNKYYNYNNPLYDYLLQGSLLEHKNIAKDQKNE